MVLAHNFIHQEEKLFFPFQQKHGLCFFCCILANNTCYIYNTCLCWYNRVFWVGTYTKLDTTNFHLNIISFLPIFAMVFWKCNILCLLLFVFNAHYPRFVSTNRKDACYYTISRDYKTKSYEISKYIKIAWQKHLLSLWF